MKKVLSLFLSICLAFSLLSASLTASAAGSASIETMQQTVRALGIIVGDDTGNMRLTEYVTRAEFAKMMVAASVYKDSVGTGSGFSLFKDVKSSHWAVEYINVARTQGWFVGYSDGNFRPENNITLEEAATASLRLLSFTSSDIVGSYPFAQLSKFNSLGLNVNLSRNQGELVTRGDCVVIFYNIMTAANKSGAIYAKTLGYTLNSSGELDFSSLVAGNMKGPFVYTGSSSISSLIPFSGYNITVYKNGVESSLDKASFYDVYYYSPNMRTVWMYDTKVVGTYTAASPSRVSPTSVTVAGNSYSIGTSTASYKLSVMGGFNLGDTVTLLIGMNGSIVDVYAAGAINNPLTDVETVYYGVVTFSGNTSYTNSSGNTVTENNVKVSCTDGVSRQFAGSSTVGAIAKITLTGSNVSVSTLNEKSFNGIVDSDGARIGNYTLATNVQILDTNSTTGTSAVTYPARIANTVLKNSDVRYFETNDEGKIKILVLNDVTGDAYSYGILTKTKSRNGNGDVTGTYAAIIKGTSTTFNTSLYFGNYINTVPSLLSLNVDGTLSKIRSLDYFEAESVNTLYVTSGNKSYRLADSLQCYIYANNAYSLSNISTVSDTNKYSVTAYYDEFEFSAGGRIRIIIATAK